MWFEYLRIRKDASVYTKLCLWNWLFKSKTKPAYMDPCDSSPLRLCRLVTVRGKNVCKIGLCLHRAMDKINQKWTAKWLEPHRISVLTWCYSWDHDQDDRFSFWKLSIFSFFLSPFSLRMADPQSRSPSLHIHLSWSSLNWITFHLSGGDCGQGKIIMPY